MLFKINFALGYIWINSKTRTFTNTIIEKVEEVLYKNFNGIQLKDLIKVDHKNCPESHFQVSEEHKH